MSVKKAGGPEGLATWWEEVGLKIPALQRQFNGTREGMRHLKPTDCPQCRIIIEEKAREYAIEPLAKKHHVICPRCGAEIRFK